MKSDKAVCAIVSRIFLCSLVFRLGLWFCISCLAHGVSEILGLYFVDTMLRWTGRTAQDVVRIRGSSPCTVNIFMTVAFSQQLRATLTKGMMSFVTSRLCFTGKVKLWQVILRALHSSMVWSSN